MYVSITGLRLKQPWHRLRFYWHAMRSMLSAQGFEGNLFVDTRVINGVHHTLTAWRGKDDMIRFLQSPVHRRAMATFPSIATGKVFGYETEQVPTWSEARVVWQTHGRSVGGTPDSRWNNA